MSEQPDWERWLLLIFQAEQPWIFLTFFSYFVIINICFFFLNPYWLLRLCSTNQVTEESSCFWVSGHFTRCWSLTQSRTNSLLMSAPVFCHSWGQSAWVEVIKAGWGFTQSVFDALGVHTSAALAVVSLSMWGLGEMLIGFVWLCFTPGAEEVNKTQFVLSWANVFVYEGNDTRFKQTALTLEVSWTTCFHQFLLLSFSPFPSSPGGSEHIWPQHYTFSQTSKPSLFSEHSSVV